MATGSRGKDAPAWRGGLRVAAVVLSVAVVAVVATMAVTASPPSPPSSPLSLRTERAGDAARVLRDDRGTLVEITSPSGIGRLRIAPRAGRAWPTPLRLRLRHAPGRPFERLEGLDLRVDGVLVAQREALRAWPTPAGLAVVLPSGVLEPGKALHVQWVDAYR